MYFSSVNDYSYLSGVAERRQACPALWGFPVMIKMTERKDPNKP